MRADSESLPDVLVVAGTGRSGTSLFTGLLGNLGFHIPKPEVAANKSNPRGFSEPRWLVDLHNELLERVDVTIEDGRPEAWTATDALRSDDRTRALLKDWITEQLSHGAPIAVKDPRLGWFIELHRDAVAETGATLRSVTMLRDLPEVMKSREIAYGTRSNNTTRVAGWLNMMLTVEQKTRDLPRAFVRYDELLTDWKSAMLAAESTLGRPLLTGASQEQVAAADALVDPSLRRSVMSWDELQLPERMESLASRSLEGLRGLVGPADDAAAGAAIENLDALNDEFLAYYEESADVARGRVRAARGEEQRKAAKARTKAVREAKAAAKADAAPPAPPSVVARARRVAGKAKRVVQARLQKGGAER